MIHVIQQAFNDEIQNIAKRAQLLPGAEQAMRTMVSKGKGMASSSKIPEKIREFIKKHPIASGAIGGYSLAGLLKRRRSEEE